MGAIFEVMSSVVSNPPPELQVADILITLSLKLRPRHHISCSFVLNHHKCPRSLSGAIAIELLCGRSIASVYCVLESSDHFGSLRLNSTVPTHETQYFATKVDNFKVPQWCILQKTSAILNRRWNWVHFLCDDKWPQPRVAPSSFQSSSPDSLMVQIHWGHFFWKIKFHLFFSVE